MDQLINFGDLASVFQLTAGVSFAMSAFREPFERVYHRLGAILDREETLLKEREDDLAKRHVEHVLDARSKWNAKGRTLEKHIKQHERWIWLSIALSCGCLIASSVWSSLPIYRWFSIIILTSCILPMCIGAWRIKLSVSGSLSGIKKQIESL